MVEVKGLSKRFLKKTALSDVSFTVEDGSVFGLIGSNGAGKSTLLRVLAGIYRPDAGKVCFDGAAPFENSAVKETIVFVGDTPYFLPQATLRDMAQFYQALYPAWDAARYEKLREVFGLDEGAKLRTFSRGMQRQAALVLAFACRPKYLLLDEIFDGLDPVMRKTVQRLFADMAAQAGEAVLLSSHNLRELEGVCDHVGILHRGNLLLERELDALKHGLCKVQAVFSPMPDFGNALHGLHIQKQEIRGAVLELLAADPREDVEAALLPLHPLSVETQPLTLEEIFIHEMEVAGYDLENILG